MVKKKTKKTADTKFGMWRRFVKYLIKKNPEKSLKTILKTYNKKEYAAFKKNPKMFV